MAQSNISCCRSWPDPACIYLLHASQSVGSGSPFIWLCAIHLNNPGQETARCGEQVAQGPVRECHCPWVVEKEAWTQTTPCLGTTFCCSKHAFESTFPFLWRSRFLQKGSLNDSCHVLGDLLVISGSFLRLTLIYSSPCSFHLTRPSKGL